MLETLTPMIPAASPDLQPSPAGAWQDTHENAAQDTRMSDWRRLWRDCVVDPRELLEILGLQSLTGRLSDAAAAQFPLRVPRGFVARMRHGDASDPLLRQEAIFL
jgi:L-lysine 2,3-aminomutase